MPQQNLSPFDQFQSNLDSFVNEQLLPSAMQAGKDNYAGVNDALYNGAQWSWNESKPYRDTIQGILDWLGNIGKPDPTQSFKLSGEQDAVIDPKTGQAVQTDMTPEEAGMTFVQPSDMITTPDAALSTGLAGPDVGTWPNGGQFYDAGIVPQAQVGGPPVGGNGGTEIVSSSGPSSSFSPYDGSLGGQNNAYSYGSAPYGPAYPFYGGGNVAANGGYEVPGDVNAGFGGYVGPGGYQGPGTWTAPPGYGLIANSPSNQYADVPQTYVPGGSGAGWGGSNYVTSGDSGGYS